VSPGDDERRPRAGSGATSSNSSSNPHSTRRRRKNPEISVVADAFVSLGYRGRVRLYVHVRRCGFCGHPHTHTGKADFRTGPRTASCQQGRYLVHVATIEQAAA